MWNDDHQKSWLKLWASNILTTLAKDYMTSLRTPNGLTTLATDYLTSRHPTAWHHWQLII
jgi:hypothetical protein